MASTPYEQRLVNPGTRLVRRAKGRKSNPGKRRMTLRQKLFFGTARQRSAAKASLGGRGKSRGKHRKRNPGARTATSSRTRTATSTKAHTQGNVTVTGGAGRGATTTVRIMGKKRVKNPRGVVRSQHRRKRRLKNVGEIVTFRTSNPSRLKRRLNNMAARRRRKGVSAKRRRTYTHRKRRTNPGIRSILSAMRGTHRRRRSTKRRGNYSHRRRNVGRRRNPGVMTGMGTTMIGLFGGGALTAMIMNKAIPPTWQTGFMGYLVTGIVAWAQGMAVAKVLKKPALGSSMMMGGWFYLFLRVLNDMVPSLASLSPYGLRGALARSSFYTPQVPVGNSFTSFVLPNAVTAAIAANSSLRGRTGRLN